MKRVLFILLIVAMLFPLVSCTSNFTFRGSHFGDSIEQVQQNEGSDGELTEWSGFKEYQVLNYTIDYQGYECTLSYFFKDNELKHITKMFLHFEMAKQQEIYDDLKQELMQYGKPTKESKQPELRKALWKSGGYGIALLVMDNAALITYSFSSNKAEMFYTTYQVSDLLSEGESVIPTPKEAPNGWGKLSVDTFIPVPEAGCDYIVRNSIRQEELALFRSNPSLGQVIASFGYPWLAMISANKQSVYLSYLVDGNRLDLKFDEQFNLIKLDYSGSLKEVPEHYESDGGKPIGIVRNDITRDELSFISTDTTPEELQAVLGAPHRECYTFDQLFDRMTNDFITFFMSGHFLYPLSDGTILDIKYALGENKDSLYVATASIYDSNGERTVLADKYRDLADAASGSA